MALKKDFLCGPILNISEDMKKIYSFACAVLLTASAWAQTGTVDTHKMMPREATAQEDQHSKQAALEQNLTYERGTEFFYEDFSNGLDGATAYGAWTTEDTGVTPIWQLADANSPGGEFSNPATQALTSESAANGWMIFDCDLYNTPISGGVEDVTGFMYSPVVNMTDLGSVILEFQQTFRYCCFPTSPLTVEVSNDEGETWMVFEGHGSFIQAANEASANPLTTQLDISCAAAGQESVQIRWAYNSAGAAGYSHYFWGIDDIRIFENPTANNIEVMQVVNGDVFNIWEFRVTPMEQATTADDGGLLVGTVFRNIGSEDQTDVVVTVEVMDADGTVLNTTVSDPFMVPAYGNQGICPPQLNDTLYMQTGWVPDAEGSYIVRSTAMQVEMDEVDVDNVLDKSIEYSSDEYGHDDPALLDVQLLARDADSGNGFDPTGYGCFYTCPNEGSDGFGILTKFGSDSQEGVEFEIRLYQGLADSPYDPNEAEIFGWNIFTLGQEWIDNSADDWVYFPFEDEIELLATDVAADDLNVYFASFINEFESDFQLSCQAQSNSDTDNSSLQYEITGAGTFVWFTSQTATPAVRLVTSQRLGVDEFVSSDLNLGQNMPNPAGDFTRIPLTLANAHNVTLEVRDMTGKLIKWEFFGNMAAGEHTLELNTADMAAGTYTYAIVAGAERVARQMVVAGK